MEFYLVLKYVRCRSIWNDISALFALEISLQTTFFSIYFWQTTVYDLPFHLFKFIDKIILFQCNRQMEHEKRKLQKRLLPSLSKQV